MNTAAVRAAMIATAQAQIAAGDAFAPMLAALKDDEVQSTILLPPGPLADLVEQGVCLGVAGGADCFVFGDDAYGLDVPPADVGGYLSGEVSVAEEPSAIEQIAVIEARPGRVEVTRVQYHRADDGRVTFEEPESLRSPYGWGRIPEALVTGFAKVHPARELTIEDAAALLDAAGFAVLLRGETG
jgi:hypothetical protein